MVRPVPLVATAVAVTGLTVLLAVATARAIRPRLPPPGGSGPIDPAAALGLSNRALYLNAAVTQAVLGVALLIGLVLAEVDPADVGLGGDHAVHLVVGIGTGLMLALGNRHLQAGLDATGIGYDDRFRRLLAPGTPLDWVLLVGVVLPTVAIYEELLFRGVLVGATSVTLGVSPWVLVAVSSLVFAVGHGLQGSVGLLAAGGLGALLGGAFVFTGSLLVVVVAHYVINVLEFVRVRGRLDDPL